MGFCHVCPCTPAMTMRADSSAVLNQASTPSLSSTGGPIVGNEPLKGGARVTAAALSKSSLPDGIKTRYGLYCSNK